MNERLHLPTPKQLTELRQVAESTPTIKRYDDNMSMYVRNKVHEMAPVSIDEYNDEELVYKTHTVGLHAVQRAMGGISAEAWEMKCIASDHFAVGSDDMVSRSTYAFGWSEDKTWYATQTRAVLRNGEELEAAKGILYEALPEAQIDNLALWSLQARLNSVTAADCDQLIADVSKVLQHN